MFLTRSDQKTVVTVQCSDASHLQCLQGTRSRSDCGLEAIPVPLFRRPRRTRSVANIVRLARPSSRINPPPPLRLPHRPASAPVPQPPPLPPLGFFHLPLPSATLSASPVSVRTSHPHRYCTTRRRSSFDQHRPALVELPCRRPHGCWSAAISRTARMRRATVRRSPASCLASWSGAWRCTMRPMSRTLLSGQGTDRSITTAVRTSHFKVRHAPSADGQSYLGVRSGHGRGGLAERKPAQHASGLVLLCSTLVFLSFTLLILLVMLGCLWLVRPVTKDFVSRDISVKKQYH